MPRRPREERPSRAALDSYRGTHWGNDADYYYVVDDPDLPPQSSEMGKLFGVVVDPTGRPEDEYEMILGDEDDNEEPVLSSLHCILAYTKRPAGLYIVLDDEMQQWCKVNLWPRGGRALPLQDAAWEAGGRRSRATYPNVQVKVLGEWVEVLYVTKKKNDENPGGEPATYSHMLGEETGIRPLLCVDAAGRLWVAGGDYVIEDRGIVN